jgi:uncharacterized protein (TIGR00266 family)
MKWQVLGNNMPAVVCEMVPGEKMFAGVGAMIYMTPDVRMTAKMRGGVRSAVARRALTGESFFMAEFEPVGGPGAVAFAGHLPGRFIPYDLRGGKVLLGQKTAFLCAEDAVKLQTAMQKKIMAGVFGGEGLLIQRFKGEGTVFLEAIGDIIELKLVEGQKLLVDTGKVVAWEGTVSYEIAAAGTVKSMAFAGEGIFLTSLVGPGKVFIQTMSLEEIRSALVIRSAK